MSDYITASEIILKAKDALTGFNFKTKLQVTNRIQKIGSKGKPYFVITLGDITEEISNVKKWIDDENELELQGIKLDIGNILEFDMTYDKSWQSFVINQSRELSSEEFDLSNFIKPSTLNKDALTNYLFSTISKIQDENMKAFLKNLFSDEELKEKFFEGPSATKKHHNYISGNLEHTVGMLKIFDGMVEYYNRDTNLNVDLIYTGIIIHDIGKAYLYSIHNGIPRVNTDASFHGHLVLGAQLISKYMSKVEGFPKDLMNRVRHMILSHHGKKEWGAVVKPQFPEAVVLHYLDMIDSRFKLNY
jgi:3'-5' exoribonuclease